MGMDRFVAQVVASGALDKAAAAKRKDHAKKARQRERRRMKQDLSAAVAADIWQDRDGKARPTAERRQRGSWVLRDGEDAGVTIAVDEHAHVLDQMASKGIISSDQQQAGHDLAALMERTRLVAGGRSCLDFTPVGHEGDAEPTHSELRDAKERRDLYGKLGAGAWAQLRMVCHEGHWPDRINDLRHGLDVAAKYWMGHKK